jgi:RNA polymerase sigma factor (sigma-70 family)
MGPNTLVDRSLAFGAPYQPKQRQKQAEKRNPRALAHVASEAPLHSQAKVFSNKALRGASNPLDGMLTPPPNARVPSQEESIYLERTFADQRAPLFRYAARLLGDPERARDVVQDTFVKLMAQPPTAINGHTVEWLFTVCRHRALDVMRKENRMKRFEEGQMERLSSDDLHPGHEMERAETTAAVLQLINRLPPNQQEVVRLKFQNGFSYKEISRITELSVGNVGFLIHTAVHRLRTEFAAQRP